MVDTVSFRQVGKEKIGKLYKGSNSDAYSRMSQPSIPSKYELLLTKQSNVKEGFGKRAIRFLSIQNENPGPAYYSGEQARSQAASPSFSKKGFGTGFVSKQNRFNSRQVSTVVPGPGTYLKERKAGSQKISRSFIESSSKSLKEKETMPAPGQYNPTAIEKTTTFTHAFRSKAMRSENTFHIEGPAPWHYNPDLKMIKSDSQKLCSTFKQPLNARRFQINLYDPHAQIVQDDAPGPGYYEMNSSMDVSSISSTSAYAHQDVDRFGKLVKQKRLGTSIPGPGSYNLVRVKSEKLPVSGATFMSESERNDIVRRTMAPGPAFYKPTTIPMKKSFHLNASTKWL